MKFFTAILACYLVLLSVIPCRDKANTAVNGKEVTTISARTNHQQDNRHKTDACTPFCNCSCCPASAFFQPVPVFTIAKVAIRASYPITDLTFVSHDDKSICEPPQLS